MVAEVEATTICYISAICVNQHTSNTVFYHSTNQLCREKKWHILMRVKAMARLLHYHSHL